MPQHTNPWDVEPNAASIAHLDTCPPATAQHTVRATGRKDRVKARQAPFTGIVPPILTRVTHANKHCHTLTQLSSPLPRNPWTSGGRRGEIDVGSTKNNLHKTNKIRFHSTSRKEIS